MTNAELKQSYEDAYAASRAYDSRKERQRDSVAFAMGGLRNRPKNYIPAHVTLDVWMNSEAEK